MERAWEANEDLSFPDLTFTHEWSWMRSHKARQTPKGKHFFGEATLFNFDVKNWIEMKNRSSRNERKIFELKLIHFSPHPTHRFTLPSSFYWQTWRDGRFDVTLNGNMMSKIRISWDGASFCAVFMIYESVMLDTKGASYHASLIK